MNIGYSTEFEGEFRVNKKVDKKTYDLLVGLATTRRMKRAGLDPEIYGIEGEFYVEEDNDTPESRYTPKQGKIVDVNEPPKTQPGLWCQWEIQGDKQTIEWDGGEKFHNYIEWIKYIVSRILKPKGYVLNGAVRWRGDDFGDVGSIFVKDNEITIAPGSF